MQKKTKNNNIEHLQRRNPGKAPKSNVTTTPIQKKNTSE